jgi:hypothetical protein
MVAGLSKIPGMNKIMGVDNMPFQDFWTIWKERKEKGLEFANPADFFEKFDIFGSKTPTKPPPTHSPEGKAQMGKDLEAFWKMITDLNGGCRQKSHQRRTRWRT